MTRARRCPWIALAGLAAAVALGGCARQDEGDAVLVLVRADMEAYRPDFALFTWFGSPGVVLRDRRLPPAGNLSAGPEIATVVVDLAPGSSGERRVHVKGMRGGVLVSEAAMKFQVEPGRSRAVTLTLGPVLPDSDRDGEPDPIDPDCPDWQASQTCAPGRPEAAGDAATSLDARADAGAAPDVRPETSPDAGVEVARPDAVGGDAPVVAPSDAPARASSIKDITFESGQLYSIADGFDRATPGSIVTLNSTTPLRGRYSADISAMVQSQLRQSWQPGSHEVFIAMRFRLMALPAAAVRFVIVSNEIAGSAARLGGVWVEPGGVLRLSGDSNNPNFSRPVVAGVVYRLGLHYRRGSGTDGLAEGFLAEGDAAWGPPFARFADLTSTELADLLTIGATSASAMGVPIGVTVDDVRIDSTALAPP